MSLVAAGGGAEYRGLEEISTFIEVALSLAGARPPPGAGAGVAITGQLLGTDGFCLEYSHAFSFSLPLLRGALPVMKHCNTYEVRDGKIAQVREYASSSAWWLDLLAQLALGRIHAKTQARLGARRRA